MKRWTCSLGLGAILSVVAVACKKDNGSDPAATADTGSGSSGGDGSGSAPITSTVAYTGAISLGSGLMASDYEVIGFELSDGVLSATSSFEGVAVGDDGSFTVTTYGREEEETEGRKSDTTYALVVRNKGEDNKMDSLERFIAVEGDKGDLLGMRPGDTVDGSTVDLGSVSEDGAANLSWDDLMASFKSPDFGDVAAEIGRTNRSLRALANVYANSDPTAGTSWEFVPFFSFTGDLATPNTSFSSPSELAYHSMGVYITVDDPDRLTFDEMCGTDTVEIYPPANITDDYDQTFGPTTPITNIYHSSVTERSVGSGTTRECGNNGSQGGALFVRKFSSEERFLFNTTVYGTPPEGDWLIKKNGTQIAEFDLSPASPFDSANHIIVYVPALAVETDSAGLISKLSVKFYVYENGSFQLLTDLDAFKRVVTTVNFGLSDSDGKASNSQSIETYTQFDWPTSGVVFEATEFSDGEFMPPGATSTTEYVSANINISYDMYGNRYRFDFAQP